MLARACVALTVFILVIVLFYSLFLKSIFLYLLLKNFNLLILIFQHPKFSLISIDSPHFSFYELRDCFCSLLDLLFSSVVCELKGPFILFFFFLHLSWSSCWAFQNYLTVESIIQFFSPP